MHELDEAVKVLVERYGVDEVRKCIGRLVGPKKQPVRKTAEDFVSGLSLPAVHKERLSTLSRLYDEGRFLPNAGQINNLFVSFGGAVPPVKGRKAAIPVVFRFLASCPTERLDRIIKDGLFAGPTELGPIADAIKSTSERSKR